MRRLFFLLSALFSCAGFTAPERIVSLDLCSDWMVARHASPRQVAALSPVYRQFADAQIKGADWPTHDESLEGVWRLSPDLVVVGQYAALQLRARLQSLGARVAVLPLPLRLADIQDYERQFLALLDLPAERASQPPPPLEANAASSRRKARLLLLGANGVGTGRGTLEDEMLTYAGWTNYLQAQGYVTLDLEQLVLDPPDAVLWAAPVGQARANRFAEHPALRHAMRNARWLSTDFWRWQCPGPWTWELVTLLRKWREQP
jgi:iron complex transport system substrate-binding protein